MSGPGDSDCPRRRPEVDRGSGCLNCGRCGKLLASKRDSRAVRERRDEDEEVVAEEQKMTFHAQTELSFDISNQIVDHDFGLPAEEFYSPAVHPPVHVLVLENEQGYPHNIEVRASDKGPGIGVTVEDVLKTIGTDLRKSSSQREWTRLNDDRRREVGEAFEDRARTEEERSSGLRRIDYLRGRNRLEIFPRHSIPEDEEVMQSLSSARALWVLYLLHSPTYVMTNYSDTVSVAGPSDKGKARVV
ncbi:hypothetical protein B0F90DRAFT_681536 [Multifurca ochricompacta]|uniref:DUF6699 domain-containing protein n=1 Tax=Multifurca ochricompacta TaxID=376703 RepID=A0AAD4M1F4_9AGAM|nr:hypothetical protein B0F90DRAFT_681536 [Multifurca ochricompacta]